MVWIGEFRRHLQAFSRFEFILLPIIVHVRPAAMLRERKPLGKLMGDPDLEKSKRATDAMLKMQKIMVADLQKAYDG